ncbi:uncharacterized protein LOC119085760 [Bradysia coprophila]|uniref:uncharacterized protein LOC119085760 n=1 Tax=Bradysia coprophila TaxID=38358 RepID=UPI00187DC066|nr:uncharacterized protein LOC119085760 [Bradysia coprophila]
MTLRSIAILFFFIRSGFAETIFCWTSNDCSNILHECDLFQCRIASWKVFVLAAVIFIIFSVSCFIFNTCSNRNVLNNRLAPPQTYSPNANNWPQVHPTNATNWLQADPPNATNWTQTYSSNTTDLPETHSPYTTNWPQTAQTANPPTGVTHHRGCCKCQ